MVALALPGQILKGVYLGILTGIFPALVAFAFGFGFRYVTGVTIPSFAVVVLALALAGVNGGLLALVDPMITQQAESGALMTAVIVVLMASLYTHSMGDRLATQVPHHISWSRIRERTVSSDVVELVGGRGQVRVEVVGGIRDMEGYPAMPEHLRAEIRAADWTFPADLPISELEARMAERLRSEFDLQDVDVSMDAQARATITAAPPASGVSGRVSPGHRAVSIEALVPTGIARGDRCTVLAGDTAIEGVIVSARSGGPAPPTEQPTASPQAPDSAGEATTPPEPERAPTTTGGRGRVTVSVPASEADALLEQDEGRVIVKSRGTQREFEFLSLLRRAGQRMRRLTVRADSPLDGVSLREAGVRETYGVVILALQGEEGWTIAPRGADQVTAGQDVFAIGSREALSAFQEAVA
ncbi:MAG: TrkA C-terminal domain-containing protein [Halodesulfurarchaeum sp.]